MSEVAAKVPHKSFGGLVFPSHHDLALGPPAGSAEALQGEAGLDKGSCRRALRVRRAGSLWPACPQPELRRRAPDSCKEDSERQTSSLPNRKRRQCWKFPHPRQTRVSAVDAEAPDPQQGQPFFPSWILHSRCPLPRHHQDLASPPGPHGVFSLSVHWHCSLANSPDFLIKKSPFLDPDLLGSFYLQPNLFLKSRFLAVSPSSRSVQFSTRCM